MRPDFPGHMSLPVDLRPGFEADLRAGLLVVCHGCRHFQERPGQRPDGWCQRHDQETWRLVPFSCETREVTP